MRIQHRIKDAARAAAISEAKRNTKRRSAPLVYLACPYSHPDPAVREVRFQMVNRAAGELIRQGRAVFSPISMCHPIAQETKLPGDWQTWKAFDEAFISASSALIVLLIPGWRESEGVRGEIKIADALGIPVELHEPGKVGRPVYRGTAAEIPSDLRLQVKTGAAA